MTTVSFAQPDVTLFLDMDGVIRNATLSSVFAREGVEDWFGRAWTETVEDVGTEKVRRMLDDARDVGFSAFRQVTQCFPSGLQLPIEYTTVRLGGPSGMVAIGKNLQAVSDLQSRLIAAQHAMEQDYWKLREVETRYRLLFDVSNEAVLLLHADSLRIVEANPAAIRALGLKPGWDFLSELAPHEREPFRAMLSRVRAQGKAPGAVLHLRPESQPWMVRASLMSAEPGAVYLLQLSPAAGSNITLRPSGPVRTESLALGKLVDRLPDGFVILDAEGIIRRANQSFIEFVQVGTTEAVIGERLDRWLTLPGADASVLLHNVRRHKVVRSFTTVVHGELGTNTEVDVSAAADVDVNPEYSCILMRDVSRRKGRASIPPAELPLTIGTVPLPPLPVPVDGLGEITGRISLKQLVQEATELVERHYVNCALDLAEGNRTAAAGLLGLSRQSLYTKLSRYGLDNETEQGIDTPD